MLVIQGWWHILNVGAWRKRKKIVYAGDENDENCHEHLIIVINTFRLQHLSPTSM